MLPPEGRAEIKPERFLAHNWEFVVLTVLLVCVSTYLLFTSQQGDTLILINGFRSPFWDVFFKIGTHFSEPVAYAAIVVIVGAFSYRKAIFSVASGIMAGVCAGLAKLYFGQARPMRWFYDNFNDSWHALNRFEQNWQSWDEVGSFPSGHTASAFALYGFLAFNARAAKHSITLFCLLIAAMVGFSRMYLLYHFLRDVTAGACLGLLVAIFAYYLQGNVFTNRPWLDNGWADRYRTLPPVTQKIDPPT